MLAAMQAAMPPAAFAGLIETAVRPVLPAAAFAAVQAALVRPATA
jgi:hypothetical protein